MTTGVSTSSTSSTGNATDISSLQGSSYSLSLAEAVSVKVQPYLDRADSIATEINTNKAKVTAYQSMQTLLQALETATSNLSSQALEGTNIFNARAAGLTSKSAVNGSTPSDASTLMSATVASGTNSGTHTVVVNQLAAAEEDVSNTVGVSSTTALYSNLSGFPATGSFSITEASGTTLSISVTSTMSLSDIASAINGGSSQTGVTASVVSINSTSSVLVVSGSDPDTALQFSDPNGILQNLGLTSSSLSTTATVTDATSGLGLSGSFTLDGAVNSGGVAMPVSVTITSGMSLNAIADAINSAATTANGGTATTLASVSGTSLTLTSGTGGSVLSFSGVTGNVLSSLGLAANGATNQVTAAQPANLTIDGVAGITRTTNNVTDALSGVSLDLTAADPNTIVTVTVKPDTTSVGNTILALVTAYNNWESFVQQNEATNSDGSASSSAVLFGDATLREASLQVDSTLTSGIDDMSLAGIGISLNSSNLLAADVTTLTSQLTTNFSGVLSLFQSQITTSSYNLQTNGTDYSSYSGTFTLSVDASNNVYVNGSTTPNSDLFTYSNGKITGVSGSIYDGMNFTYSGTLPINTPITVSATVGLANQLYTTSTNYGNTLNGSVQNLVTNLQGEDADMTSQYNTIIAQANSYTTFLLQQYAALTTQIQNASYTSTVLSEMFATQTSGSG